MGGLRHPHDRGGTGTFRFCPVCGSTVPYQVDITPGLTAIPIGDFADPAFPPPNFSRYENRRQRGVAILGVDVEHG